MSDTINETLSIQSRKKKSLQMRRLAKRLAKARVRALRKAPSSDTVRRRAKKQAINMLKKKIAKKDISSMSAIEKQRVEDRIKKLTPVVNRLTKKLLKKVRADDKNRRMASNKVVKEGVEILNTLLEEKLSKKEGKAIKLKGKKTKVEINPKIDYK